MQDLRDLKKLYEYWRILELNYPHSVQESQLADLTAQLRGLKNSPLPNVQRLAEIEKHLFIGMSAQHFSNFLLPIERALDRGVRDDEILVSENDNLHTEASKIPLEFALDNLRSSFNVGSIFRTAECLGVQKIYCTGYTPSPQAESTQKTSMGTHNFVSSSHLDKIEESQIQLWKDQGLQVIALETVVTATSLFEAKLGSPSIFIVGNERFGLGGTLLKNVDQIIRLPVFGVKNSLNVASTLAIAGFEWRRQWELKQNGK